MRGWRTAPSNGTIHHTGVVDVATIIDTINVVEEDSTVTTKEAEIKQCVTENIATLTEIAHPPVENGRPALRATSKPPPLLICKAAALTTVIDIVERD